MNRKRPQGFTLMEMLVVIMIIAIVSTGGVAGWQRWQQHQRLHQAAQQMRDWLYYLRSDANWHNAEQLLWFRSQMQGWCLGSGPQPETNCTANSKRQFIVTDAEIQLDSLSAGLGFYGIRNTAWPGHITLSSPAGRVRLVVSTWGRIRLCQPESGDTLCK